MVAHSAAVFAVEDGVWRGGELWPELQTELPSIRRPNGAGCRRRLGDGEPGTHPAAGPGAPVPQHLTSDLFNWWEKELAIWNTVSDTLLSHPSYPTHGEFHEGLQKRNVTIMLDAYYELRKETQLPVAAGWKLRTSRCPPLCTTYGTCNEELSRCDCPIGRGGPDCSAPLALDCEKDLCYHEFDTLGSCTFFKKESCINQCNDRGACISQFCHCFPGYFGSDCSLSLAKDERPELLAGLGYQPNAAGPKIYIYELPSAIGVWHPIWVDRPVMAMLWERSLSGGYRTARHEEADYFLVPAVLRVCAAVDEVLSYLRNGAALPFNYLARHGGRDHLALHTGDYGRCEWPRVLKRGANQTALANVTFLQHWGLTVPRPSIHGVELGSNFDGPCHYINQDILLPPDNGGMRRYLASGPWHPLGAKITAQRTVIGFFAGGICGWMSATPPPCHGGKKAYSLGVRERLYTLFQNSTDFVVAGKVADIGMHMRRSIFCFAPLGGGWGRRGAMAVLLGCIPVVISDDVMQSWEPFLDWGDFGLRVAEADLPRIEAILRAITPQEIAAKQAKLECAAKHISWSSVWGGYFQDSGATDAVGTLMAVLAARQRNPGFPDAELRAADAVFDDFMACRAPAAASGGGGAAAGGSSSSKPPQLCSYSRSEEPRRTWEAKQAGESVTFCPNVDRVFMAGGHACSGAKDLAHCVRPDLVGSGRR